MTDAEREALFDKIQLRAMKALLGEQAEINHGEYVREVVAEGDDTRPSFMERNRFTSPMNVSTDGLDEYQHAVQKCGRYVRVEKSSKLPSAGF